MAEGFVDGAVVAVFKDGSELPQQCVGGLFDQDHAVARADLFGRQPHCQGCEGPDTGGPAA